MNIDMIRAAAGRLDGVVRVTPLLWSPGLDALAGRRVWVKAENLQLTGSFKFRGAWAALTALSEAERQTGVLAYSSGNHAQGIAYAAQRLGMPAVIVMPSDAPLAKIDGTRAYGAEVVLYNRATEDRDAIGAAIAGPRGMVVVPPYDHPQVIAGQGTTGLEIAAQARAAGITQADVICCCGGGGLSAGIAMALAADAPGLRLRTAEPAGFDDMARSLATGRAQTNAAKSGSVCDAILTPSPGTLTLPILWRLAGPGLVVTDDEALAAVAAAFRHLRIVLEPGGAVGLAAALFCGDQIAGDQVIAVASGGNVDPGIFAQALAR
jgi:threonine dehydratase